MKQPLPDLLRKAATALPPQKPARRSHLRDITRHSIRNLLAKHSV